MSRKCNIYLIVFSTLLIFGCNISGKITYLNGDPMEGVLVTLTGNGGPLTTSTNEDGNYEFTDVQFGRYVITPEKEGETFYPVCEEAFSGSTNVDFIQYLGVVFGISGVYAIWEPTDISLYETLLPEPLEMPVQPMILQYVIDLDPAYPTPYSENTPYKEGTIALRCKFDGEEGWHSLTMPVDHILALLIGWTMGYPKYMADEITITQSGDDWTGTVFKSGKIPLALAFDADENIDVSDIIEYTHFHDPFFQLLSPVFCPKLIKSYTVNYLPPVWNWDTGIVQITVDQDESWYGVLPEGGQSKGVYQVVTGGMLLTHEEIWRQCE